MVERNFVFEELLTCPAWARRQRKQSSQSTVQGLPHLADCLASADASSTADRSSFLPALLEATAFGACGEARDLTAVEAAAAGTTAAGAAGPSRYCCWGWWC